MYSGNPVDNLIIGCSGIFSFHLWWATEYGVVDARELGISAKSRHPVLSYIAQEHFLSRRFNMVMMCIHLGIISQFVLIVRCE